MCVMNIQRSDLLSHLSPARICLDYGTERFSPVWMGADVAIILSVIQFFKNSFCIALSTPDKHEKEIAMREDILVALLLSGVYFVHIQQQ